MKTLQLHYWVVFVDSRSAVKALDAVFCPRLVNDYLEGAGFRALFPISGKPSGAITYCTFGCHSC